MVTLPPHLAVSSYKLCMRRGQKRKAKEQWSKKKMDGRGEQDSSYMSEALKIAGVRIAGCLKTVIRYKE